MQFNMSKILLLQHTVSTKSINAIFYIIFVVGLRGIQCAFNTYNTSQFKLLLLKCSVAICGQ